MEIRGSQPSAPRGPSLKKIWEASRDDVEEEEGLNRQEKKNLRVERCGEDVDWKRSEGN
jgi:hypothetical protein